MSRTRRTGAGLVLSFPPSFCFLPAFRYPHAQHSPHMFTLGTEVSHPPSSRPLRSESWGPSPLLLLLQPDQQLFQVWLFYTFPPLRDQSLRRQRQALEHCTKTAPRTIPSCLLRQQPTFFFILSLGSNLLLFLVTVVKANPFSKSEPITSPKRWHLV